jgi:Tfp pilus assembly protein PilO
MDPLETAIGRLDAAMDRLDSAATRLIESRGESDDKSEAAAELEALRGERDRLRTALDAAKRQNENLRSISQAVSSRLDDTIGRVRVLLEDGDGPSHGSH